MSARVLRCVLLGASAIAAAMAGWAGGALTRAEVREARDALAGQVERARLWTRRQVRLLAHRFTGAEGEASRITLGEVSEMIDVVRLGLSAGLSFDAALELYCQERKSGLSRLLAEALVAWRIGAGTREGELLRVARITGLRPLESFATAVSQAIALGAPLAEVLASQGREIRAAHRADVERQIERAPVKLLIPTGTLILPALLLSIMGPLLAASGML